MLKELDHNVYVKETVDSSEPIIQWSPADNDKCTSAFKSISEFNNIYHNFSQKSKSYINYSGPLFKGKALGLYQTLSDFPGNKFGTKLPKKLSELIGYKEIKSEFVGAYPPVDIK